MTEASIPTPDPTILTTRQVEREIAMLRDIFETHIRGIDDTIKKIQQFQEISPSLLKEAVGHLQLLHEERFSGIAVQFKERDTRTEQTARDSKVAVDAALQAAKEAVGEQNKSNAQAIAKSEAAFTKQIDQLIDLIRAMGKGTDEKIDDIKTRTTTIEGMKHGAGESYAQIASIIALLISLTALAIIIFNALLRQPPP